MKDHRFKNLEINEPKLNADDKNNPALKFNCPACGKLYDLKDSFCANCGGDLRNLQAKKNQSAYFEWGDENLRSAKINSDKPANNKDAHEDSMKTQPVKTSPSPMTREAYQSQRQHVLMELKYRILYVIIMLVAIIIILTKPEWFTFF